MLIYGINPVLEALRAGRATELRISRHDDPRLKAVLGLAARQGVPVKRVDVGELDAATRRAAHQGIVAEIDKALDLEVADLVGASPERPLLVVLDGIEDPQNLGAILRVVDAAGAGGVIRQARRAAALGGAAAKASAGAVAHVRIATVVNIARALEELRRLGVWTVGLAADATQTVYNIDFTLPTAIVLGAEGSGLRRLVRERCDLVAAVPMRGHVGSLNVAAAAAVVLFEAVRQRRDRAAPSAQ